MSSLLWNDVHQETKVAGLFNRIDMPTSPFDIPLQLGDVNWYPGSENTAVAESTPKTAKQTLTAHELVAEVPWSLTLEEDAVFAVLPEVRRTLVRNAAEVIDDVLLNADRTPGNGINSQTVHDDHHIDGWHGALPDRLRRVDTSCRWWTTPDSRKASPAKLRLPLTSIC